MLLSLNPFQWSLRNSSPTFIARRVTVANAMVRHTTRTAVSNNSWGPRYPFTSSGYPWRLAVEHGLRTGFNGKGAVYVFSGGNNHRKILDFYDSNNTTRTFWVYHADNANYDGNANHHAVVAVCATNNRGLHNGTSEFGANLWVCAPGRRIYTTERNNRYDGFGSGTSLAAPIVSGVVALLRQANPSLTWRDVKLILAHSARQNDAADNGWSAGAMKYGSFSERYHFNHKYGFGIVDAQAAVNLAEDWINLPPREVGEETQTTRTMMIANITTSTVLVQSAIDFIEHVEIPVGFSHPKIEDLSMKLTAPSGTVSELMVPTSERVVKGTALSGGWHFGSSRHLGENPSGTWTLAIADTRSDTQRTRLGAWAVRLRGYQITMQTTTRTCYRPRILGCKMRRRVCASVRLRAPPIPRCDSHSRLTTTSYPTIALRLRQAAVASPICGGR